MANENHSVVAQFLFMSFFEFLEVQVSLFFSVLVLYLVTLVFSVVIIMITVVYPTLCSPMYFFLQNLSFLEIGYTSSTIPKMMVNVLSEDTSISFLGCATQTYFFSFLGITECCLQASMAYDHYVATCHRLRYTAMMNTGVCLQFLSVCWLIGMLLALGQTTFIFTLPYCEPNSINHIFCNLPLLLKLACTDTYGNEVAVYTIAVSFIVVSFLLILLSYIHILHTILSISSAACRRKAFSTCYSHLIVVTLFYGNATVTHLMHKSSYSLDKNKLLSLFSMVVCLVLNPLIYSLRNKEVKGTLGRGIHRKIFL